MHTDDAMHQRKWGNFPALAAVVGTKTSTRWDGLTSVSGSARDRLNDLLDIYAFVMDNEKEISQMAHAPEGDPIQRDLRALSEALGRESGFLADLSRETHKLTEPR